MKIGVVTGLPREIACLDSSIPPRRQFKASAGFGAEQAERAASAFVDSGVTALMSFGVAGGLSALVPGGTIVLATTVVDGESTYLADTAWLSRLELGFMDRCPFVKGPLAGTDQLVATLAEKQELHNLTRALACDMESHAVARVAASHNLPFTVVRAISDPHDRYVPDWVIRCLTSAGKVKLMPFLLQSTSRPRAWGQLIGLSLDTKKAFKSLRSAALCLGPSLRF